jgi:hypothetical protein
MKPTGRCLTLRSPALILHFSPHVGHSNIGLLVPMMTSFAVKSEVAPVPSSRFAGQMLTGGNCDLVYPGNLTDQWVHTSSVAG